MSQDSGIAGYPMIVGESTMSQEKRTEGRRLSKKRRQNLVRKYRIRGLSSEEIAVLTHVHRRTVERDFAEIKDKLIESLKDLTPDILMSESRARREEIMREVWALYHNSEDAREKMQALQLILKCDKEFIEIAQSVGILAKVPDTAVNVGVQVNVVQIKKEIIDDIWEYLCPACKEALTVD